MPRSRLVLLIWIIGTTVLLGAWSHSLFRKTLLRHNRLTMERQFTVGLVRGSVEITWGRIIGKGRNMTQVFIFELKEGSVPGGVPNYFGGRFHYHHLVAGKPPTRLFKTTLEFPLWPLILLYTLLCGLLYRRYQKHAQQQPIPSPPNPSDPNRSVRSEPTTDYSPPSTDN